VSVAENLETRSSRAHETSVELRYGPRQAGLRRAVAAGVPQGRAGGSPCRQLLSSFQSALLESLFAAYSAGLFVCEIRSRSAHFLAKNGFVSSAGPPPLSITGDVGPDGLLS